MDSSTASPIAAEPPSFLSSPLSDSDTHNHSSSISDARNNKPPRSRLPNHINRGIENPKYNVKYPTNNYVSTHWLFESNKSFTYHLYIVSIPNSVQEALADPYWQTSMNEEMKSLKRNVSWQETCGKQMSLYNQIQGRWYH